MSQVIPNNDGGWKRCGDGWIPPKPWPETIIPSTWMEQIEERLQKLEASLMERG